MYKKRTLYIFAGLLLLESVLILTLPSRAPRAVRGLTVGFNLVAAIGLVLYARHRK